jgi:tetratricopeptide (TPR) repeat protein
MFRRLHPLAAVLVAAALTHASIPVARAAGPDEAPVDAEASEDPEALSAAAVDAFHAKDYDKAIELFERAYQIDPQPNYRFNIGRVYEEKGDLEKAVAYYQEFVKAPGVDLEARESASARLKVLRQALQALQEEEAKERAAEEDEQPAVTPIDEQPTFDDGARERKRKLRIAGYSLIGVGGAGLVVGAVFGGLALSKSRDAEDAPLIDDKLSLRREAKTRAAVADAMLVTGGVLAGVGLVLVLSTLGKGGKRDRAAARSAFAPTFGPRGAGLAWTARF